MDDPGIILVLDVAFDQPAIELNDHWQGELLVYGLVEPSDSLNELDSVSMNPLSGIYIVTHHQSIVVRTGHGDRN